MRLLYSSLVFTALVLVNVIVSFNTSNKLVVGYSSKWFTHETINSLSSIKLNSKMKIQVFYDEKSKSKLEGYYSLLKDYLNNIEVEFLDPDLNPKLVRELNISIIPMSVFKYNGHTEYLSDHNELNLVNLIQRLTRNAKTRILFTVGHGELSIQDSSSVGISHIYDKLIQNNIEVGEIDLLNSPKVNGSDTIVIAGAKSDLSEAEFERLEEAIHAGVSVAVFFDPFFSDEDFFYLRKVLAKYRLSLRPGYLKLIENFVDGSNGLAPLFSNNFFLQNETRNSRLFFPFSSVVFSSTENEKDLFKVSRNSSIFLKSVESLEKNNISVPDKNSYSLGKISLITDDKSASRIFALGNSTFLQNKFKNLMNSTSLFSKAISSISKNADTNSLNIPSDSTREIFLEKRQGYIAALFYSLSFACLILFFLGRFIQFKKVKYLNAS